MNITHIINLFRAYFIENKKRLLICCLATFAALAFGFSFSAMPEVTPFFPYFVLFFLVAFGNSSLIKNSSHHFNTLPASTLEKFVHAIFSIICLGVLLELFALAGACTGRFLIMPFLRSEINTHGYSFLSLFLMDLKGYLIFAMILALFLFTSIYFKKNAFLKTIGVSIGFNFAISLYFLALIYISFRDKMYKNIDIQIDNSLNINLLENQFFQTYWYLFPIAIIIFFLSLTYLRLRETEV